MGVESQIGASENSFSLVSSCDSKTFFSKVPQANTLNDNNIPQKERVLNFMTQLISIYPIVDAWKEFGLLDSHSDWSNIREHCSVTATYGYELALYIGLGEYKALEVAAALAIHDADKPQEIKAIRGILESNSSYKKKINDIITAQQSIGQLRDEILITLGFPEEIVQLSHANMPVMLSEQLPFNTITEAITQLCPQTPEVMIVHLIDALSDGSLIVTAQQRFVDSRNPVINLLRAQSNNMTDEANAIMYGISHLPTSEGSSPYPQLQRGIVERSISVLGLKEIKFFGNGHRMLKPV